MSVIDNLKSLINTPDDDSMYANDLKPKLFNIIINTNYNIQIFKPISFEDAISIAKSILDGKITIVNLSATNRDIARRIIDFLSGTTFDREIQIKKISNFSFIFSTCNIKIDETFVKALKDNNIDF